MNTPDKFNAEDETTATPGANEAQPSQNSVDPTPDHQPFTIQPESSKDVDEHLKDSQPVERDYEAHRKDPAPSEEAVFEENEDGAGKVMKWIIPAIVIVLVILWLIMR